MTLISAHLPLGRLERNERVLAEGQVLFFIFCSEKLDVWRVCVCKQAKACVTQ